MGPRHLLFAVQKARDIFLGGAFDVKAQREPAQTHGHDNAYDQRGDISDQASHDEAYIACRSGDGRDGIKVGALENARNHAHKAVAQHAAAWGQPDAVSIALPCVVCRGTVIACNGKYTDAVGFDWARWSQKTFGAPVFLMTDAAAALLGEMRCGAAKDTDAAAILMIGTGIGSAAAQDRRILTGRHGTMGMLGGHMAIEMLHPRRCTCGAMGCLEAWAGTWALDEIARQEDGFAESALANARKVDYRALLDGVAQGDAVSLRVFETVATALGMGAVNLIHAYDPEVLLLSGGPCHSEMLMQRIRRYVRENVWTPWGQVDIRVAENPEGSVLLGLIRE